MSRAVNHAGWVIEKLTNEGWVPLGHLYNTRESAEFVLHAHQRYDKEHEFRVYEALFQNK